jgi:hypothetical protein
MRIGGRSSAEGAKMVLRPMLMAVELDFEEEDEPPPPPVLALLAGAAAEAVEGSEGADAEEEAARGRARSPRRTVSDMSTVLPARVMLWVPEMWARRETLLPESWRVLVEY